MNIKADATIVGAAGNLARAQVPFSMKGMDTGLIKSHGELMDSIRTSFKSGVDSIVAINEDVRKAVRDLEKNLSDGTVLNQEEREAMQAQLDEYRKQLKEIGLFGADNKKKRNDLLYEVNKYTSQRKNEGEAAKELITTVVNGNYDEVVTENDNPGTLTFMKAIANHYNPGSYQDENIEFTKTMVDGHPRFSAKIPDGKGGTIEFKDQSFEDVNNLVKKQDNTLFTNINKVLNDKKDAAKNNAKLERDDLGNQIEADVKNECDARPDLFSQTVRKKVFGQDVSFYDALHDPNDPMCQEVLNTLYQLVPEDKKTEIDKSGPDGSGDPDGVITPWTSADSPGDFASKENYEAIVRTLTNPNATERDLAHSVYAKFIGDREGVRAIDLGIKYRPDKEEEEEETTTPWSKTDESLKIGATGGYLKHVDAMALYNKMLKAEDGEAQRHVMLGKTFIYDPTNNEWYENYEDDEGATQKYPYGSTADFVSALGINEPEFLAIGQKEKTATDLYGEFNVETTDEEVIEEVVDEEVVDEEVVDEEVVDEEVVEESTSAPTGALDEFTNAGQEVKVERVLEGDKMVDKVILSENQQKLQDAYDLKSTGWYFGSDYMTAATDGDKISITTKAIKNDPNKPDKFEFGELEKWKLGDNGMTWDYLADDGTYKPAIKIGILAKDNVWRFDPKFRDVVHEWNVGKGFKKDKPGGRGGSWHDLSSAMAGQLANFLRDEKKTEVADDPVSINQSVADDSPVTSNIIQENSNTGTEDEAISMLIDNYNVKEGEMVEDIRTMFNNVLGPDTVDSWWNNAIEDQREQYSNFDPAPSWCAAYISDLLLKADPNFKFDKKRVKEITGKDFEAFDKVRAQTFLGVGEEISMENNFSEAQIGDIVVKKRGGGHHVGMFAGIDKDGNVKIFGGNQELVTGGTQEGINIKVYPADEIIGVRRTQVNLLDQDQVEAISKVII